MKIVEFIFPFSLNCLFHIMEMNKFDQLFYLKFPIQASIQGGQKIIFDHSVTLEIIENC